MDERSDVFSRPRIMPGVPQAPHGTGSAGFNALELDGSHARESPVRVILPGNRPVLTGRELGL